MSLVNTTFSFRSIFRRTTAESEAAQFGRDARADWQTTCFVFLFLNVLSIVMSVFVYGQINKGEFFLIDKREAVSVRTLDRFELERTVSFFSEKQSRFDALLRAPLSTSDPFIPKAPKR